MSGWLRATAALVVLSFPLATWGHGFGFRSRSMYISYYPASVVCVPVAVAVPCPAYVAPPAPLYPPVGTLPPPLAPKQAPSSTQPVIPSPPPGRSYAPPSPAPPSTSPPPLAQPDRLGVPPLPDRISQFSETRSFYDVYTVAPRSSEKRTGDRVSVSFWNLSDRDLTIKLDGKANALPRGKNVTLDASRQFVWQVEGRDPQKENIGTSESGLEIVIRR